MRISTNRSGQRSKNWKPESDGRRTRLESGEAVVTVERSEAFRSRRRRLGCVSEAIGESGGRRRRSASGKGTGWARAASFCRSCLDFELGPDTLNNQRAASLRPLRPRLRLEYGIGSMMIGSSFDPVVSVPFIYFFLAFHELEAQMIPNETNIYKQF